MDISPEIHAFCVALQHGLSCFLPLEIYTNDNQAVVQIEGQIVLLTKRESGDAPCWLSAVSPVRDRPFSEVEKTVIFEGNGFRRVTAT